MSFQPVRATRALALAALVMSACASELGDPEPWVPLTELAEPLRAEQSLPPAPGVPGATLRVVSFNVERGPDVDAIARAILAHPELARFDILMIQEIDRYPSEGSSRAARLAAALGVGHVYAPGHLEGSGDAGLAILTRFPLENVRVMRLPFAGFHIRPVQRVALAAEIRTGDTTLELINVHLDTRLSITERILQIRPAVLDAPTRVLVAGDMNTNPYLWAESTIPAVPLGAIADTEQGPILDDYMRALDFATPTACVGTTEHLGPLEYRLDAIYTRDLRVDAADVASSVGVSDHWPIWVDLGLEPERLQGAALDRRGNIHAQ